MRPPWARDRVSAQRVSASHKSRFPLQIFKLFLCLKARFYSNLRCLFIPRMHFLLKVSAIFFFFRRDKGLFIEWVFIPVSLHRV